MLFRVVLVLLSVAGATPAAAQYVLPLATGDGRVGCTQGMTGIGRPQNWQAVRDAGGLGGWALSEVTGDATDLHFPFCIDTQIAPRDFDATMRFKIISGTHEQAAGLMFRARDATDYLVARASALDGTVKLYRILGGRRSQLATAQAPVKTEIWSELRVVAIKDRIEVSLDGKTTLSFTDRSAPQPGTMGVWVQSDSRVLFGSLLVANVSSRPN
jgi:hypothetical protein